jgi:pimeloyl-ACP methyl ester carboxylesterase
LIAAFVACWFGLSARAVDVVIFKDGYKIQGRKFKEQEVISDPKNGVVVQIPAARGFDVIEDGPKWIIFSSNSKQTGHIIENLPAKADQKDYKRDVYLRTKVPLPAYGEIEAAPFDKNWKRMIKVKTGGGNFHDIEQRIHAISPTRVWMISPTHNWHLLHYTREMSPQLVRNLLTAHPDLAEPDGKPDPAKRIELAKFFKEVGWLDAAREELDKLKEVAPGPWPKEQTERYDQLRAELPRIENKQVIDELEASLFAGRYDAARGLIAQFDPKLADAAGAKRFADLKAQVDIVRPRYGRAVRLLRAALDELGDANVLLPRLAAAGGLVRPFATQRGDARIEALVEAGEQVALELHPDTTGRVELFLNLATQAEQQRKAGKSPGIERDQLVALAVTGWLKGKNGAEPSVDAAVRLWQARQMLTDYQNVDEVNSRRAISRRYLQAVGSSAVPFDELAQLISLLPPARPEDLANPDAAKVPVGEKVLPGLWQKNTGPLRQTAEGVNYILRLPPEYHHGRPYPVLLALTHPGVPAEQMVSLLAAEADRHGYIVAAPVWPEPSGQSYDYSGDLHYKVTATLRSLLRHYRVDNDRVFLFGFGDGANFAMDVGASHPDLFAGLVAMGPTPKYFGVFMHYWRNLQKLPVYAVTGNINGGSLDSLRRIYEHWMPKGFPALMSVYRGRGLEWYAAEVPAIFKWMRPDLKDPDLPKKRVTGTASLRLGQVGVEPWYTMRAGDNRFYWVGTDEIADKCLLANNAGKSFMPAEITADIREGNRVELRSRGIGRITVWLDRDMIDWSKPVYVRHNGNIPKEFKPKTMKPDLDVMLEEFYRHGDRRMLFLNKIELNVVP